jgi:replicative DNA helicase
MTDISIESLILNNLVNNEPYTRKAMPHIKPEYFTGSQRVIYELILDFISKYNKLPNASVLDIEFQKSNAAVRPDRHEILQTIHDFGTPQPAEHEWLVDSTEKWCKDRAVHLAVMEAISIIDGKSSDKAEGAIPEILNKALSVTFDTNVGHDYLENADRRFDFYHHTEDKIEFDLDMFNQITNGGVPRKTLNIILAGTGVGKSLGMCHLAAADLSMGRNVLYITMEMAEERIAERIDANLLDVRIDELKNLSKTAFTSKIKNLSDRTKGKIVIKEYPTASAHSGHFRALLHELKLKKKFMPDVIYIDYLNICASSRIKGLSGSVNTYSLIKAIAEELRGLAVEFNVPIWSATQVTRGGYNSSDVELTDTSESFGLPATADLMIAFISTEQLEKMNQLMIKQLKNRYNDANTNKRFTVGIDRSKMRLYDVADPTANIMNDDSSSSSAPVAATPFSRGGNAQRGKSFNDFKV